MHVVRAKTAGESAAETTRIARRLFISPPPQRIVLPIVAFSLMEAYLLVYPSLDGSRVLLGSAAVAVPAYLSAFGTVPLANRLGGRMYFRRSFLLSFVGLILLGAFQLVAVVVLTIYTVASNGSFLGRIDRVTILGYGAVLWVREVILSATSNSRHLRSLPAASLHPLLGLAGLALFVPLRPDEVILALAVYALFFLSAIAYAEIAKRPLLRSFGVDGLKLLRSTLDHYTEPEASGIAELEAFFDSISVAARVRVGGLAFRVGARLKALFVAPTVHPGPMGYVSGSDLPSKIARDLTDLTPNVLVAHGPTTHDENPATTSEVHKAGEPVPVGYGTRRGFCNPDQGIGARGIEALVVEAGGQRTAYVLFDGNNMVPGVRDAVRARIASLVQESEAMTTDNHSVNLTMDGFNAVGAVLDTGTILAQAEAAVREAIESLEPAEAGAFAADIPDFRIFGPQSASRLTTTINSTLAVLRPALYITLSGAVALGALVMVLF